MMSIASIKAGKAFYEIFAEDKTANGLSSAEAALQRFGARVGMIGASLVAVAAAGLTSLSAMASQFSTFGDEIGDAMAKTGVSAEWLQVFDIAADKADVSFNQIVMSIGKMQRGINDGKLKKGLATIGISLDQLSGMKPEEQFLAIGDAIGKIADPAARSAAAVAIFGKVGMGLLPLFEGGAQGLLDTFNTISKEGAFLDAADIKTAGELDDAMIMLNANLSQLVNIIGAAVAPALTKSVNLFSSAVRMTTQFVDNNRVLVTVLSSAFSVIGAVGLSLMALGGIAIAASLATTGLTMAWAALGTVLAIVTSPAFVIAAALALCAAQAGVAAYQLDQVFNAGKGLTFIAGAADHARTSLQLLMQALVAGEWGLAGEFIATTIENAFDGMIYGIKQKWADLITFMVSSIPGELGTIVAQDMQAGLADDQAAFLDSSIRLAKIAAQIARLRAGGDPSSLSFAQGPMLSSVSGSIRDLQTTGVLSSAAASRINQSSPANQWQDKLLAETESQGQTLEEIRDQLDDLDNLTVE